MLKESLDRLCNIAGGFAVVATAGAATGGVVLGVAGAMAAGGSLVACIQQNRRADFGKVLKKVSSQVAKDYPSWLEQDSETSGHDIAAAIATFDNQFHQIAPSHEDFVTANLSGEGLAKLLLARAAEMGHSPYRDTAENHLNRHVFRVIVTGTFELVRAEPLFRQEITSFALGEILNRQDESATRETRMLSELADMKAMMQQVARETHRDLDVVRPLFEHLQANGIALAEMPEKVREAIAAWDERRQSKPQATNLGGDIDATISSARQQTNPQSARAILDAKIVGEDTNLKEQYTEFEKHQREKRQLRMLPLLKERYQIERITFDYAAAKSTLHEIETLDQSDAWALVELGDIELATGTLSAAMDAYDAALAREKSLDNVREQSICLDRIGDVQVARNDLAGALKSYTEGYEIRRALYSQDKSHQQF